MREAIRSALVEWLAGAEEEKIPIHLPHPEPLRPGRAAGPAAFFLDRERKFEIKNRSH